LPVRPPADLFPARVIKVGGKEPLSSSWFIFWSHLGIACRQIEFPTIPFALAYDGLILRRGNDRVLSGRVVSPNHSSICTPRRVGFQHNVGHTSPRVVIDLSVGGIVGNLGKHRGFI